MLKQWEFFAADLISRVAAACSMSMYSGRVITMKAISKALGILSLFLLLHFLVYFPLPLSFESKLVRESIKTRRLLQPLDSDTVNTLKNINPETKKPQKAIKASLRMVPVSKSNPMQNYQKRC